jgi:Rrf2 family protein
MKLSLQVQYAVCGVFDLAYNGQGEPVQVRVISERQAIPGRYLEQIFRRLRRAELVTSKRGPGGGYLLARPPREITLRQVVEAVEGPVTTALEGEAPSESASALRPDFIWSELSARLSEVLDEVDLESLCRDAARAQVERANSDGPMYFI